MAQTTDEIDMFETTDLKARYKSYSKKYSPKKYKSKRRSAAKKYSKKYHPKKYYYKRRSYPKKYSYRS